MVALLFFYILWKTERERERGSHTRRAILSINLSADVSVSIHTRVVHINHANTKSYKRKSSLWTTTTYRDAFCLREWIECSFCVSMFCICVTQVYMHGCTFKRTHARTLVSIHFSFCLPSAHIYLQWIGFTCISIYTGFSISTKWIRCHKTKTMPQETERQREGTKKREENGEREK